jgi:hypothetical protein
MLRISRPRTAGQAAHLYRRSQAPNAKRVPPHRQCAFGRLARHLSMDRGPLAGSAYPFGLFAPDGFQYQCPDSLGRMAKGWVMVSAAFPQLWARPLPYPVPTPFR